MIDGNGIHWCRRQCVAYAVELYIPMARVLVDRPCGNGARYGVSGRAQAQCASLYAFDIQDSAARRDQAKAPQISSFFSDRVHLL